MVRDAAEEVAACRRPAPSCPCCCGTYCAESGGSPTRETTAAWSSNARMTGGRRLNQWLHRSPAGPVLARKMGQRAMRRSRSEGEETDAMLRATVMLGEGGWEAQVRRLARALSPVAGAPAAPRETVAALDAWGPSLMPRSARVRGVTMGLGILGARATSGVADRLTRLLAPADAPLPARLVAWAMVGGAGAALAAVPERHCRRLWVASLQSTGLLLRDGAAGGVVHEVGRWLQRRYPDQRGVRPLTGGAVHTAGLLYRVSRRLPSRGRTGDQRPRPEPADVAETLATSYVVTTAGMGLARGFDWSRGALESYLGPGPSNRALRGLVNAGLWAGAAAAAYSAGVAYVGRANQRLAAGPL